MGSPRIHHQEVSMSASYFIGLDIHKKMIAYRMKENGTD